MGWREFADALDAFKGTGLGAGVYRNVVGERDGLPLCRYCALGAAYRATGRNGTDHLFNGYAIEQALDLDIHERGEVTLLNDNFRCGSDLTTDRRDRLRFMRLYAHGRARGFTHGTAADRAGDVVPYFSSTHPTAAKGAVKG